LKIGSVSAKKAVTQQAAPKLMIKRSSDLALVILNQQRLFQFEFKIQNSMESTTHKFLRNQQTAAADVETLICFSIATDV
jgi:hypothetical protein